MSRKKDITLAPFLLLPDLHLTNIVPLKPWGIGLCVEKTTQFEVCPHCAQKCYGVYDHQLITCKDEPIRGKAVILFLNKRRFSCRHCKRVFTEPVPGISKYKKTTQRFQRGLRWA